MKQSIKPTRKRSVKRNLFAELTEGMDALTDARHGKRTLRTHSSSACVSTGLRLRRWDNKKDNQTS
jgi:hypothetical protein